MSEPAPPLWSVRRRPSVGLQALAWLGGAAFCLGSLWLLPRISPDLPRLTTIALAIGLGYLIPLFINSGTICYIGTDRRLYYGYGRTVNLALPLSAISQVTSLERGLLRGVGLVCEVSTIEFFNRRGPSHSSMRAYRRDLSVDLVLENLTSSDAAELHRYLSCVSDSSPETSEHD